MSCQGKDILEMGACKICGAPCTGNRVTCCRGHPIPAKKTGAQTPESRVKLSNYAKQHPEHQRIATEAALRSPKSGPYETNFRAEEWHLLSPSGQEYHVRNLNLFAKKIAPNNWYNFSCGIQRIRSFARGLRKAPAHQYKGWTILD